VSAYLNDLGGTEAGLVYLVAGPITADLALSSADARLIGEDASDHSGRAIAGAGDIDGDGLEDMLVGARGDDDGGSDAGAVYVVLGPTTGDMDLSAADAKLTGDEGDYVGAQYGTSGAGDVDGDGYADILIGASGNREGGANAGAAYLLCGPVSADQGLADGDAKLVGAAGDGAGSSVASAGDVDADGSDDLLIGASANDEGGESAGAAFLVYGPVTSTQELATSDVTFIGDGANAGVGYSVATAGDVDADGYADLLLAAPWDSEGGASAGAAYLILFADMVP